MKKYSSQAKIEEYQYFYLICLRTHMNSKIKTFKLGRTSNIYCRFKNYPKNNVLPYLCGVENDRAVERIMINIFDQIFIRNKNHLIFKLDDDDDNIDENDHIFIFNTNDEENEININILDEIDISKILPHKVSDIKCDICGQTFKIKQNKLQKFETVHII